jgi:hypothetical protein
MRIDRHKAAALFLAPALALGCGAAAAAPDEVPDALRERSSPGAAAMPVHVAPAPANAMSPEWERRMARTPRQEEGDRAAGTGTSTPQAGTTERMAAARRGAPAYEDDRGAPWSRSPY